MEPLNEEVNQPQVTDQEGETESQAARRLIKEKITDEQQQKAQVKKNKRNRILKRLGIVAAVALLWFLFSLTDLSKVKSIKVINNTYLSDEYILSKAGLSYKSHYLTLFPSFRETMAKSSPLIKDIEIERGPQRSVIVTVEENNIVGYRYEEKMELVLSDGSFVEFKGEYIKNLSLLPMFMSVPEEKTVRIAKELSKLEGDILVRIAEIRDFALSYDADMVKFVMDNNYKVYCSVDGIHLMKEYMEIIKNTTTKTACIQLDTVNNVAIVTDCKEIETMYQEYLHGSEPVEQPEETTPQPESEQPAEEMPETE